MNFIWRSFSPFLYYLVDTVIRDILKKLNYKGEYLHSLVEIPWLFLTLSTFVEEIEKNFCFRVLLDSLNKITKK